MKITTLLLGLQVFFLSPLFAEVSESFQIRVLDRSVKVISPKNYSKKMSAIIENKTLTKLRGVLQTPYRIINHIAINPEKTESIQFEVDKDEKIEFVPLSPAFQAIELRFGQNVYEIPAKK